MDDMATAIGTVEEALGVLNVRFFTLLGLKLTWFQYLFFSLPSPFLRLNETVIADPEGVKTCAYLFHTIFPFSDFLYRVAGLERFPPYTSSIQIRQHGCSL